MEASCKNCRKIFNAKNALFCSISCYKFYTDALERKQDVSSTENVSCVHEYAKNGTMSCRKCGCSSLLVK